MRAMVLQESGPIESNPLRLTEAPEPWPGEGEIRIKVAACAICRTDLHVIEEELPRQKRPVIPGHQIVGVVDSVGKGVKKFRVGDRVGAAWLRHTCSDCSYCHAQQENLCEHPRFTGYHADGGFAEFAVAKAEFAYEIPSGIDLKESAPLLCAGIIGFRALKRAELPKGGTLGLFGFGSSAHIVLQIAKARGSRVYVVSMNEGHQVFAKSLGADWVGGSAYELPKKLDSSIVFAPSGEIVPSALSSLKKGGTLALAGIHMTPIPQLDYEKHLFYEKTVRSVTSNTRADGIELIQEALTLKIRPKITTYLLKDANRALQDLKRNQINGSAVLVP